MVVGKDRAFIHRFVDIVKEQEISNALFKGNMNTLRKTMKRFGEAFRVLFVDQSKTFGGMMLNVVTDVIVLSEDVCFNESTLVSDNLRNVWRLHYTRDG